MMSKLLRHSPLLACLLLALSLRLVNLGGRPFWYDEAFAVLYAEKPFAAMLYGTITPDASGAAADVHPLFYYSLLHGWLKLVGDSPAGARSLSVLFGVATVGLIYLLGKRLFEERVGLSAALLVALSPFHVYYSQEARMYALLGLVAMAALFFFVRAWEDGGWGNWVGYAFFAALTLYAHNLGAIFLAVLGLWLLGQGRQAKWSQRLRPVLAAHLLAFILLIPWLAILPAQFQKIGQAYWVSRPGLVELLQTLFIFHFAYDNQALPAWLLPLALLFSLLMVALLIVEWRRRSGRALLAMLAFLPILFTWLVSQYRPVYIVRALLPSALVYAILVARVLLTGQMPRLLKWALFLPALLIALAALVNHYRYDTFPRGLFRPVATYLAEETAGQENWVIVHSNKLTFLPTYYYNRTLPQQFIADAPGSPSDTLAYPTQQTLGLFATPSLEMATAGRSQVWLVIFQAELAEFDGQHPHLVWLNQHYTLASQQNFNDLLVYQFNIPNPVAHELLTNQFSR